MSTELYVSIVDAVGCNYQFFFVSDKYFLSGHSRHFHHVTPYGTQSFLKSCLVHGGVSYSRHLLCLFQVPMELYIRVDTKLQVK